MKISNVKTKTYFGAACFLMLSLLSFGANAAIYMFVEGLQGDVTAQGYEGWINVTSVSEGMTMAVDLSGGAGGGTGKVNLADTSITKLLDSTSPQLRQLLATGKSISRVEIAIVKPSVDRLFQYFLIRMTDVFLSSVSMSGDGDSVPSESVSMHPSTITWTYTPQMPDGHPGAPITTGWDFVRGTKI